MKISIFILSSFLSLYTFAAPTTKAREVSITGDVKSYDLKKVGDNCRLSTYFNELSTKTEDQVNLISNGKKFMAQIEYDSHSTPVDMVPRFTQTSYISITADKGSSAAGWEFILVCESLFGYRASTLIDKLDDIGIKISDVGN